MLCHRLWTEYYSSDFLFLNEVVEIDCGTTEFVFRRISPVYILRQTDYGNIWKINKVIFHENGGLISALFFQ